MSAPEETIPDGLEVGGEAGSGSVPGLRWRVISGARAQVVKNVIRGVVQIGGVAVLLPVWGLDRYGEWLVLSAFPTYFALSDLGFFAAARYDMIMAVARGDRAQAEDVFRAVSRGVGVVLVVLAIALPIIAWAVPLTDWLNLKSMSESTAASVVVMLGVSTLLISYTGLLSAGFACVGRYGEGTVWLAAITLADFIALATAVVSTKDPAVAAAAMLGTRAIGIVAMYWGMRRRAPWLKLGKPAGEPQVLKRLTSAALASAALPAGVALNVQGMVVIVGVVAGPASAAVFSTVRTVSRVVIQLLTSISSVLAPEFSKAFGERDVELFRRMHRRGCRAALWVTLPIIAILAVFGSDLLSVWTSGRVETGGLLLYLFLAATAVDSLWWTSAAVLFSTNRHQRIALVFVIASILALPVAWALLRLWSLEGAALGLLLLEVFMLFAVLRQSIPAAHDRVWPWLREVLKPPTIAMLRATLRLGG